LDEFFKANTLREHSEKIQAMERKKKALAKWLSILPWRNR
jgi:hypothetical protein